MVSVKRLASLNLVINMLVFKVHKVDKDGIALLFHQSFMRFIPVFSYSAELYIVPSIFAKFSILTSIIFFSIDRQINLK